ncbi:ABC transporter permease subunit [Mycoplasma putrefaciens]|uniref:Glycerol ABC transporter, permease subunit C n=2 Tax=Mycoplasma putrefaciens TaxID=2123 RepID=A0A7U3ZT20_MYCPK|nr:ABC transporter permease subunit [Mycoplasma putrefaciens]ACF32339.1 GtsC [Mycoplasma putrefaciens KS1]AEM68949.1 Glycerol ABC transporter, permease subunit C [Mycoplasma putrefaciens KS1]
MYKIIIKEIIKYLLMGFLCVLLLFPLYFLLLQALLSNASLTDNKIFWFIQEWNWQNFAIALKSNFLPAVGWTLLFVVILTFIRIVVYSLAIAGLLKMSSAYQKTFQYFFLIISLIPEFSLYLSLKTILIGLNWNLAPFAVVTNSIFSFFNFTYIFNLAKAIKSEKQKIIINDNLKWHQQIAYVYLPKMKLGYLLLVIFSFISCWNDYIWPLFILPGDYKNVTIWYQTLGKELQFQVLTNVQAAGAMIAVIVPIVIYAIFSKKINNFN